VAKLDDVRIRPVAIKQRSNRRQERRRRKIGKKEEEELNNNKYYNNSYYYHSQKRKRNRTCFFVKKVGRHFGRWECCSARLVVVATAIVEVMAPRAPRTPEVGEGLGGAGALPRHLMCNFAWQRLHS
jgi:hypothetical protein